MQCYAIIMYLDQYKCPRYKFFSFFTTLVSSLEEQDACTSPSLLKRNAKGSLTSLIFHI